MAATKINVHAVINSITNAEKQIQEQEATLSKIDNTINSNEGVWESEDQRVYAEKFRNRKQKINDFNRAVTEYLSNMRTYVSDCVAADDQTARDLAGISW